MKTLKQLDAEYERKRAEILARDAYLKMLPRIDEHEVKSIFFPGNGRAWVQYSVDTLAEAYAIVRAFWGEFHAVSAIERGCLDITVAGEHPKFYQGKEPRWTVLECIAVEQSGGKGFYTASVEFYPTHLPIKVEIDVKKFPHAFRARMDCTYNRQGDPVTGKLYEPSWPAKMSFQPMRVKFAGGSADSFNLNYYFSGPEHFAEAIKEVL